MFADPYDGKSPKISELTFFYHSSSPTPSENDLKQVIFTQSIPKLEDTAESITWSALDLKGERQEKGEKKAAKVEINVYYDEDQHKELKTLADNDTDEYWFVKYPESTAKTTGKPLVKRFIASCDLVGDEIPLKDFIKDVIALYRKSAIEEFYGMPTATSGTTSTSSRS